MCIYRLVMVVFVFASVGCAANIQGFPQMVSETDTTVIYTARGFTDPGEKDAAGLRKYPEEILGWQCKKGGKLVSVRENPWRNVLGQVGWDALIECNK